MKNSYHRNSGDIAMTDRNSIQVLERAFLILEEIANSPNVPHPVSKLAEKTGLKVPTVSKIVRTMNNLGYLEFAGRRCGYLLGHKTVDLSRFYRDSNPLRRVASPLLHEFREQFGEYICVSVLLNGKRHLVCVELGRTMVPVSSRLYPEVENPCRTLSGRILLSGLSRPLQEKFFDRSGIPDGIWPGVQNREEFLKELRRIRKQPYLIECSRGGAGMAACPIVQDRRIIASLGCFLPEIRFRGERQLEILDAMTDIAKKIGDSILL